MWSERISCVSEVQWTPTLNELLPTIHEQDNIYDRYAKEVITWIYRRVVIYQKYIKSNKIRGATITVKVIDTHHHRFPLVQGSLEIPVKIIVKMQYCSNNKDVLAKYESLVSESYKETVSGKFEDVTSTILSNLDSDSDVDSESSDSEDEEVGSDIEQVYSSDSDEMEDKEVGSDIVLELSSDSENVITIESSTEIDSDDSAKNQLFTTD